MICLDRGAGEVYFTRLQAIASLSGATKCSSCEAVHRDASQDESYREGANVRCVRGHGSVRALENVRLSASGSRGVATLARWSSNGEAWSAHKRVAVRHRNLSKPYANDRPPTCVGSCFNASTPRKRHHPSHGYETRLRPQALWLRVAPHGMSTTSRLEYHHCIPTLAGRVRPEGWLMSECRGCADGTLTSALRGASSGSRRGLSRIARGKACSTPDDDLEGGGRLEKTIEPRAFGNPSAGRAPPARRRGGAPPRRAAATDPGNRPQNRRHGRLWSSLAPIAPGGL